MSRTKSDAELVAEAQAFYDARLKRELEPHRNGEFVAIDPEREEYAVAENPLDADEALRARGCRPPWVLLRVGYAATYEFFHSQ